MFTLFCLDGTDDKGELIEKEKRGEIAMEGIKEALDRRYKMKE